VEHKFSSGQESAGPGIKKVAHFFLSAREKESFQSGENENGTLIFRALTEKERTGIVWLHSGKNNLILTSVFAHGLGGNALASTKIRVVGIKVPLESWLEFRSHFPSLPYSPPIEDSSGYALFSLSPKVEFAYVFDEEALEKIEGSQDRVAHLVSLSGQENVLKTSFFQQLNEIVFITPPDRASLTELYQALKWLSKGAPWISAGILLDGAGFSYSEARHLFEEYRGIVTHFLNRSLNFYGLCDSERMLKQSPVTEPAVTDICFF
jgi:hypothetical protein